MVKEWDRPETVEVSRKTLGMLKKTASQIKAPDKRKVMYSGLAELYDDLYDREQTNLRDLGHYEHPEDVENYIDCVQNSQPGRAIGLWKNAAYSNLQTEVPDYDFVKKAANRLDLLGEKKEAEKIRERMKAGSKLSQKVVLRQAGWSERTMRYRRPKTLAEKTEEPLKVILIGSLVAMVGIFASGVMTGSVIGGPAETASVGVAVALIALLVSLFLILKRR